jgi:hypothetical protein
MRFNQSAQPDALWQFIGLSWTNDSLRVKSNLTVWGLCGENCPKFAKVWKIIQNVENRD